AAGCKVETYASAHDFLAAPKPSGPTCAVVDVSPPDMDGLELQDRLANRTSTPIVFIARHADVRTAVRAIKAGAVEFLTKPLTHDALLSAIATALELSRAQLHREAETASLDRRYATLTPRESQVMSQVVIGRLNKQIAGALRITEVTVKAHRGNMMRK